jgi:hypothetical protein
MIQRDQLNAFVAAIGRGGALYTDANEAGHQMRAIDACYEAAGLPLRGP